MKTGIEHWLPDVMLDDAPAMNMGSASGLCEGVEPTIRHAMGFQFHRSKPRIRIKAWTRPIPEGDFR